MPLTEQVRAALPCVTYCGVVVFRDGLKTKDAKVEWSGCKKDPGSEGCSQAKSVKTSPGLGVLTV